MVRFAAAPGVRPTPDRVRETLFNWLGQDLTGATTLEPLCRQRRAVARSAVARRGAGASPSTATRRSIAALDGDGARRSASTASRRTSPTRWRTFARERRAFDVVFLDPPFADDPWAWLLPACAARLARERIRLCGGGPPDRRRRRRFDVHRATRGPGRCIIICSRRNAPAAIHEGRLSRHVRPVHPRPRGPRAPRGAPVRLGRRRRRRQRGEASVLLDRRAHCDGARGAARRLPTSRCWASRRC